MGCARVAKAALAEPKSALRPPCSPGTTSHSVSSGSERSMDRGGGALRPSFADEGRWREPDRERGRCCRPLRDACREVGREVHATAGTPLTAGSTEATLRALPAAFLGLAAAFRLKLIDPSGSRPAAAASEGAFRALGLLADAGR